MGLAAVRLSPFRGRAAVRHFHIGLAADRLSPMGAGLLVTANMGYRSHQLSWVGWSLLKGRSAAGSWISEEAGGVGLVGGGIFFVFCWRFSLPLVLGPKYPRKASEGRRTTEGQPAEASGLGLPPLTL